MPLESAIPLYCAVTAYILAAALALSAFRKVDDRILIYSKRTAAIGNTFLLVVFLIRWWQWGRVPFTGMGDSLNLFLVLCTGIMLTVQRNESMRPLLCVYMPTLAVPAVLTAVLAPQYLGEPPVQLDGVALTVHVGLVFFAFALFFVASITSMVYAIQARLIKRHKRSVYFSKLPSLEQMERTLFRLIYVGYPLFLITVVFGLVWAHINPERLGAYWYVSPRVLFAFVVALFFGVSLYVRKAGLLRGPKLAYVLFFGFTSLLVMFVALELFSHSSYRFWDSQT